MGARATQKGEERGKEIVGAEFCGRLVPLRARREGGAVGGR